MSKIYAQQKKPHEVAGADSTQQAVSAFSNQAMLDLLKAPENVRAKPLSQEMHEKMSQHFGVSLSGIKVFEMERHPDPRRTGKHHALHNPVLQRNERPASV